MISLAAAMKQRQSDEGDKYVPSPEMLLILKLQLGLAFANSLPPEADAHYAGHGVSFGAADTPIFWYRPKDSKTYRVIYADLSVREAETPPKAPVVMPEQDLISAFRCFAELTGGPFPSTLNWEALVMDASMKLYAKFPSAYEDQKPSEEHLQGMSKLVVRVKPGIDFAASLPPEADAHYAGRGVSLGTPDRPIFWYRPKDSKTYRVIYADLSVRDADTAPNVTIAPPEQDLIDAFRYRGELSDEPLSGWSDGTALDAVLKKKFPNLEHLDKDHKPTPEQMREIMAISLRFLPGQEFIKCLPPDADAHYGGKGVKLGTPDRPIFWYRPKDSKKYRVIYADLSVRDADAAPDVPDAEPVPSAAGPKK